MGADRVIDYTKYDFSEIVATYDIIFDTVGKSAIRWNRLWKITTMLLGGTKMVM